MKKTSKQQRNRDVLLRLNVLKRQRRKTTHPNISKAHLVRDIQVNKDENTNLFYYPIIDVSDQYIDDFEQMGTKSKFWYTDSRTGEEFLFKSIHTEDRQGNPIERRGEDWAEKIACELAEALGIPHAHYELANYKGQRGIRSKKFTTDGDNMFFGNQLIEHIANRINVPLEKGQRSQKVDRVAVILARLINNPPKDWVKTENITSSFDVFIGYLLLDTLISNQDRHNENWGMIINGDQSYLAPSFDHAASLGRNESVEKMHERLVSKDEGRRVPTYVSRSKSYFYNGNNRLKTLEAFLMIGYFRKRAALEWLERLESLDPHDMFAIVDRIPDQIMGRTEKTFCKSILIANQARILTYKQMFLEEQEKEDKVANS
ncbi:TPA: HipA domain-containing protein [Vibrio parahaemolyticus]|nr:HipA domain-containing protein [Vibrio parahaemolyticus]HCG8293615.1 HipA domain-containing protein [Vibrio parahaemolyticus]HCG8298995.1 HipA domain-containing protein [Vibrio parahaemolyticus]HCG8308979.1 HipA domain-containing protein [Vibrio parahaemolyticus]HCH0864977.1 HipA domain-containing protein [Vibrio parahaemolyticus]